MSHVTLTCEDHPNLRWGCKEIAVGPTGRFWGGRTLFFHGDPDQPHYDSPWPNVDECPCDVRKLIALTVWQERQAG